HTLEPTQQDMIAMADADAVYYSGDGLESFTDNAKKTLGNVKVEFLATSESISEDEHSEGHSQEGHDHSHEHEEGHNQNHEHEQGTEEEHNHNHEDTHDHSHEVDPHVWISPVLSQQIAASIKDELIERDGENAEEYEANYEA